MIALGLAVAAAAVLLDQLTKAWVLAFFGEAGCAVRHLPVTWYFDLVLICNPGISFGMFNQAGIGSLFFTVVAAAIVVGLLFWLSRARTALLAVALGFVIGGAVGNVIDRLRFGAVIDFLYFHAGSWYWPAFNIADAAICLGVVIMLLEGMLLRREEPQANRGEDVSR